MKFLLQWREKIELLDAYSAVRAKINMYVALTIVFVMALTYPVLFKISPENLLADYIFIFISLFFLLISIFLSIRNPINIFSGYLVLGSIFIIIANACFYYGGIRTPGTHLFILVPMIASFLVSRRAEFIIFALSNVLIVAFFILWKMGKLPEIPKSFIEKENLIKLLSVLSVMVLSFVISYSSQKIIFNVISELKQAYDFHPNGIVRINTKGKILYSNSSFEKLFQQSYNNIEEFFQNEFNSKLTLHLVTNSQASFQVSTSSGRMFIVNFIPYKRFNQKEGLIFFLDNTLTVEKSNLEKLLAEKNAKAAMIATYNHEINNPLTIALGYAKKLKTTNSDKTNYLKLYNSLKRIEDVVKEIDQINH